MHVRPLNLWPQREKDMTKFMQLVRDESGATAIEYALIASLISVVIIGAVIMVGMEVKNDFTSVAEGL